MPPSTAEFPRTIQSDTLAVSAERLSASTPADALEALESRLAALEGGRWSLALTSGRAAADAVLALVPQGGSVVAGRHLSAAAEAALAAAEGRGVEVIRTDTTDPVAVAGALRTTTALLWLATPAGPELEVTDVRAAATIARLAGVRVAVDNSAWTAAVLRPLDLGADLVVYTEPAALAGSPDAALGAIAGRAPELRLALVAITDAAGRPPAEAEIARALLGLETLSLRTQKQELTALLLARRLEDSPHIKRVISPALPAPGARRATPRQSAGIGGLLAIEVRGGPDRLPALAAALRLWTPGPTPGGNRATFTTSPDRPALITLSPGLEDPRDLLDDLERALRDSADAAVRPVDSLQDAA